MRVGTYVTLSHLCIAPRSTRTRPFRCPFSVQKARHRERGDEFLTHNKRMCVLVRTLMCMCAHMHSVVSGMPFDAAHARIWECRTFLLARRSALGNPCLLRTFSLIETIWSVHTLYLICTCSHILITSRGKQMLSMNHTRS